MIPPLLSDSTDPKSHTEMDIKPLLTLSIVLNRSVRNRRAISWVLIESRPVTVKSGVCNLDIHHVRVVIFQGIISR